MLPVIGIHTVSRLVGTHFNNALISDLFLCLFLLACVYPPLVQADYPTLKEINIDQVRQVFTNADEIGPPESAIAARPVYANKQLLGYIALTHEIIRIPGYSGKPVAVLIGIGIDARINGAKIIYHEEPILVAGIQERQLHEFVQQYKGKHVDTKIRVDAYNRKGYEGVDGISGATITVMVLNRSIMGSARKVSGKLGLPILAEQEKQIVAPATVEAAEIPVWEYNWREKIVHLIIMGLALSLLLMILFLQDILVKRTRLFNIIRISFLLFTVFFIGFWHMAQLSIINILAFARIVVDGFTWYTLMIDPLIFQLWGFIALISLLWGGGVFCGWLCPFGALQELIYKVAEKFELPSFEIPTLVHERLLALKYFILIALVGLSLESLVYATRLAELEPFKTTFIFHFQRPPVFAFYALGLLAISAFNSKFYCKYLCPLGAALSFITRFRVFDWLRRRKECGRPCQVCAAHCQMNAIKPTGEIISSECQYCLECQVYYWDEHVCPPLVEKRIRRNKWKKQSGISEDVTPANLQNKSADVEAKPIVQYIRNKGEKL